MNVAIMWLPFGDLELVEAVIRPMVYALGKFELDRSTSVEGTAQIMGKHDSLTWGRYII